MLQDGRRIYPIAGEIHLGRLPASQWREQLLRMRAGGLNWVSVYLFWVYFEESRGTFTFGGRRNVSAFLQVAGSLGLRVLLRIGPWCHGEVRNGGHPDWTLTSCGSLRSQDPKYLACVSGWYTTLASQLNGLFWKDGGPVVSVQVDNETSDWKYLLALRSLALSVGIRPAFFVKTGWPAPSTGYPATYPMLPLFGGYADQFWTNRMAPSADAHAYVFAYSPSGHSLPGSVPWLDVEIGGGMAAAYNHRVHMDPDDMPAMHLVDVGSGVNGLGYYMYHGGNNPHSVVHDDSPEYTLQESSFQPAGAQNPMPSISYDFFAPLGEFGQPRPHYHSMRRLHLLARRFGSELAATVTTLPQPVGSPDNGALRWSVRSNRRSGFLFVNNYQRLANLSAKPGVRFHLRWTDGHVLDIPSNQSVALTVPPASWFVWPFGLRLFACPGPELAWATAQVLTEVGAASGSGSTVFLVETAGVAPLLAFVLANGTLTHHSGNARVEGGRTVIWGLKPGYEAVATISLGNFTTSIVLLPAAMADKAWIVELAGVTRLALSDEAELLLGDGDLLRVRAKAEHKQVKLLLHPTADSLKVVGGGALPTVTEGAFGSFLLQQRAPSMPLTLNTTLVRQAGPPREIPLAPSGKAQEPNADDWKAAAEYTIELGQLPINGSVELRFAIDYAADAARLYLGDRLLTDNWLSGYYGSDGAMEAGLSYLSAELPALLLPGTTLRLLLLPLRKASLQKNIWLQPALWPNFRGEDVVCRLDAVRLLALQYTDLTAVSIMTVEPTTTTIIQPPPPTLCAPGQSGSLPSGHTNCTESLRPANA